MKRYNITAPEIGVLNNGKYYIVDEYANVIEEVPGNDTWAASATLEVTEDENGEWIRYEDASSTKLFCMMAEGLLALKDFYRTLIKKYIMHIRDNEGVSYLEDHYRERYRTWVKFEDEEWEMLQAMEKEIDE